jgi:peptidyl-prolyl cis-trans isomerase A (cyclophilin A)
MRQKSFISLLFVLLSCTKPSNAGAAAAQSEKLGSPEVVIETNRGKFVIKLFGDKAPISTRNFLKYVEQGHYNNTIFHRVIPDFMVQGGGFTADLAQKSTGAPIKNEAGNGLHNKKGTVAMARTNIPDSATSQFFINVKDNPQLDQSGSGAGYAVFGEISSGMDVIETIRNVPTRCPSWTGMPCDDKNLPPGMRDVPTQPVTILKAYKKK